MQIRSCLRLRPHCHRLGRCHPTTSSRPFARNFSENHRSPQELLALHSVRILRPTLWSVGVICTIYFSCAAFDVYQDAKGYSKDKRPSLTFEQIQADRAPKRVHDTASKSTNYARGPRVVFSPLDLWHDLSGAGKVIASVAGINALTLGISYVPSTVTRKFYDSLAHIPAEGAFQYRQLITSTYSHTGPVHLGLNMLVMYNFASQVAEGQVFNGSGSHTLAFYLSAGIMSSLGHHISTNFWPNKMARFAKGMGFSGVAYAILAAWCVERRSDSHIRLYLVPWTTFTPGEFLVGLTVFETAGALGLLNWAPLHFAYGAHLSGLMFGVLYAMYASGERCWTPFRRAAFRGLKAAGAV